MQRSHLTLWLALVGALWSTQCDSLSDDCKKTLTCGDAGAPVLNPRSCQWEFPDGRIWAGGPRPNDAGRWVWPNGSAAPTFDCVQGLGGSGGAPDNCTDGTESATMAAGRALCDPPLVCDLPTRDCVQCLNRAQCEPGADASAPTSNARVCDTSVHQCVECTETPDCQGTPETPFCLVVRGSGSSAEIVNECVECLDNPDCTNSEVCDPNTNECTLSCSNVENNCRGDKPVCDFNARVCVECNGNTDCSGATSECNMATHECVQCTTDPPCQVLGQVCDTAANRCVECNIAGNCVGNGGGPLCDPVGHQCVPCLVSADCTDPNASRCNEASHTCTTCTADNQCEAGATHCTGGKCVECIDDADCPGQHCDIPNGVCVDCLIDGQCPLADAARCEQGAGTEHFTCQPCTGNTECSNKANVGPFCNLGNGTCSNCLNTTECGNNATAPRCANGACGACVLNADCTLVIGRQACKPNVGGNTCVECVENEDCVGVRLGADPFCKVIVAGGPAAAPINTCVECIDTLDCTPEASLCPNNQCVPCLNNGDCDIAGFGVCDTSDGDGVCVECTAAQRTACDAFVCDSLAKTCTSFGVASAVNCGTCVSDAQCAANSRCVEQTFGAAELGFFCFPQQAAGLCPRGFGVPTSARSIDEQTSTLCLQPLTTCPAFRDAYIDRKACLSEADDVACGVAGLADGSCVPATSGGFVCSISCGVTPDCFNGTCAEPAPGAPLLCTQ